MKSNYLRTEDQITKFCTDNSIAEISTKAIAEHLEKNGQTFLGYFNSMHENGFWTYKKRGGQKTNDNQFKAHGTITDLIINDGVFSDSQDEFKKDVVVALFGKMLDGKIDELTALNTGNFAETYRTDRTTSKSKDLWF